MTDATTRKKIHSTPASVLCTLFGTLILIASLIICGMLIIPELMGYQSYVVLTGSMEPTIPTGSIVFVETVEPEMLEVGEVVTFYQNGAGVPVSHRIVEIDEEAQQIYTKGDANAEQDFTPTDFTSIVGIVRFSVPVLGTVAVPLSTVKGKAAAAGIVLFGCILLELGGCLKKKSADESNEEV